MIALISGPPRFVLPVTAVTVTPAEISVPQLVMNCLAPLTTQWPSRAEQRDGHWVVNGAKQFITNCGTEISAGVTVTAVTGKTKRGGPEISAIMIPTGTPGYHVLESYRKLGWH